MRFILYFVLLRIKPLNVEETGSSSHCLTYLHRTERQIQAKIRLVLYMHRNGRGWAWLGEAVLVEVIIAIELSL